MSTEKLKDLGEDTANAERRAFRSKIQSLAEKIDDAILSLRNSNKEIR